MRYVNLASAILALILIFKLSGCKDCEDKYGEAKLQRLIPSFGSPGTQIEVVGTNNKIATKITFGSKSADFTGGLVTVPDIPAGNVEVYLTYACGETNRLSFQVLEKGPTINDLKPSPIEVGQTLTITGQNFTDKAEIFLEQRKLTGVIFISKSQLNVTIPFNSITGNISVKVDGLTSGSKLLVINNPFLPKIESILPVKLVPGKPFTLHGNNFLGDNISLRFNQIEAESFTIISQKEISGFTPLMTSSGILTLTTQYGATTISYTTEERGQPFTDETIYEVYMGEKLIITGKNFFSNEVELYFGGLPLNPALFKVLDEETIEITFVIGMGFSSNNLSIKTTAGETTVQVIILNPPLINDYLPAKNPIGGPFLISGTYFGNLQTLKFEASANSVTYNINSDLIQYLPGQGKIGLIVPNLAVGVYNVSVINIDGKESNQVSFEVTNGYPSGLPSSGAHGVVYLPSLPNNSVLNSFNNNWNLVNTRSTINFYEDFTSRQDSVLITESFNSDLTASGNFLTDGSKIEITFGDGDGSYLYRGSLDDKYGSGSVKRIILTPVVSGTQIEMIFPLALDQIIPSTVSRFSAIEIKGVLFLQDSYQINFKNSNGTEFTFDFTEVNSSTSLIFNIPSELPIGSYKLSVIEPQQLASSNALDITIID